MSTILLIPRKKGLTDASNLQRIMDGAKQAAAAKTHFLIIVDPEEYDVYAALGTVEKIEADEHNHTQIRINLSMFEEGVEGG